MRFKRRLINESFRLFEILNKMLLEITFKKRNISYKTKKEKKKKSYFLNSMYFMNFI